MENDSAWTLTTKELFTHFNSSDSGLTDHEVTSRLLKYGTNEIAKKERRHGLEILFSQFKSPLVIILMFAAITSYFLGGKIDSLVIISIVIINSILGFFQEYRAERTLRELKKLVSLKCKVVRNGQLTVIDAKHLVPGDIVHLDIGDMIPADIRLLSVDDMSTDESSLTGESNPSPKTSLPIRENRSVPQYLHNFAFMGTSVASGSGHGIVIDTGMDTFFGKTAAYLKQKAPEADFQKSVKKFSNFLLKVTLAITLFIFIANAILEKGIFDSFLFAIALAVGITPEVLPIIMTITLSNGALKMAKEKVITKKLSSVEDFGNIDTLCCDKTGTLTEGHMTLIDHINLDGKKDDTVVLYGLLCSPGKIKGKKNIYDNPINQALWESKKSIELSEEVDSYETMDKNDFDYERRRLSVLTKKGKNKLFISKGAPESIIKVCRYAEMKGKKVSLTAHVAASIHNTVLKYESQGYTVIAVSEKQTNKDETTKEDEKDLTLIGFLLFLDPPKDSVKESLETLQRLGVNIKVISGDSPIITRKICNDVGLDITDNKVITGDELEHMNDRQFEEHSMKYNVFARITPGQKYRIVSYLNKEGHVVGFLGDGVNDAPALKAADVGISVDSATGIAKEAADIILLKKSLKVLADGIITGRKTFGNITKYIFNTISANYGNMLTVASSSLFLKFIPLLPSQILLTNFVTDVPMLAVSTDNVDEDLLRKPKKWNIRIISRFMIYFGLISSIFDLALILPLIFILNSTPELLRTSWFIESVLSELIIVFALRTRQPFLKSKPSRWLVISSILAAIASVLVPFTIYGARFFGFVNVPTSILSYIAVILLAYFITAEIAKKMFFRRFET